MNWADWFLFFFSGFFCGFMVKSALFDRKLRKCLKDRENIPFSIFEKKVLGLEEYIDN